MERLIMAQELKTHSIAELFTLLASINRQLACTQPGTYQRRNAIASSIGIWVPTDHSRMFPSVSKLIGPRPPSRWHWEHRWSNTSPAPSV